LAQARQSGVFTATHEAFWQAARAKHGDGEGTRALIEVLLLHRRLDDRAVLAGIRAALAAGSINVDVVAIEARKLGPKTGSVHSEQAVAPRRSPTALVTLGARAQAAKLPPDTRAAPSTADYDQLLPARATASGGRST